MIWRVVGATALSVAGWALGWAPGAPAAGPTALVLAQGNAFSVLGFDCGGIAEQVFATQFDPVSGYPDGDVFLSTTCNGSGRGGRSTTHTAWASATWDFTGTLVSSAGPIPAPGGLNPTLSVTDAHGNVLVNESGRAVLELAPGFVPPPRLTALSTISGPASGGTAVVLSGTGFSAATAVRFGSTPAASFTVTADNSLTALSPAAAPATVDVTVTSEGGISATGPFDRFTFVGAPTVTSLSPNRGGYGGGTPVTITGSNLGAVTAVRFGDSPAGFVVDGPTSLTATSPPGTPRDTVGVSVVSIGGRSRFTPASTFTYTNHL